MPFISSAGRRFAKAKQTVTPVPSVPDYGALKIKIIGDSSSSSVATNLQTAFSALGYTGSLTFNSSHMNGSYTGSDLTVANYDVVVLYMNGGLATSTVGANLNSFAAAGGKIISCTFVWNIPIPGFTYTNTPWVNGVGQSNTSSTTYTVNVTHPITNTISTNLVSAITYTNTPLNLQTGATKIASLADGNPFIAVWDKGATRLVGFNYFTPINNSVTNRLIVRAIGWCMSKI